MFLLLLHVQFMQPGFYFFDSHGRICNHRLTFHAMAPISHKILSREKNVCIKQKRCYTFSLVESLKKWCCFLLSNDALCMINAPLWWRIGKPWIHWEKQIWFFFFLVTVAAIWLRNGPITQPVVEQLGIIASGILVFPIPSPWLFSLFSILDQSLMVWWITS